jgi:hypothetical protein
MEGVGFASAGKNWPSTIKRRDSLIPALFDVVVRQKLMRRRSNPDSEPNIRRIDTKARAKKQTHGFQVHFLRGVNAVTRMFSDSLFGGKEGARRAARKYKRSAMARAPKRGARSTSRRRRRR